MIIRRIPRILKAIIHDTYFFVRVLPNEPYNVVMNQDICSCTKRLVIRGKSFVLKYKVVKENNNKISI